MKNVRKPDSNPRPTKERAVVGFAISLLAAALFLIYLVWLIVPEEDLESLGITVLPQRYWAVATPIYLAVVFFFALTFVYPNIGLYSTVPLQEGDLRYIIDSHTVYNEDSFGPVPDDNGRIARICDMYPRKTIETLTRD